MIKLENVCFSYKGKQVLDGFSLNVRDGERVCLFGESGIGKTTITRLILGLESADSGNVECTQRTAVVFQEDRLLPFKTVFKNIKMFSDKSDSEIEKIIDALGIALFKDKYPSQLSGGISRRTALARALCTEADAYIFDEPFSALDSGNTDKAIDLINKITKNKTVILITHNEQDAVKMGCKIVKI